MHFIWNKKINEKIWQQNATAASVSIWRGFAFAEQVGIKEKTCEYINSVIAANIVKI